MNNVNAAGNADAPKVTTQQLIDDVNMVLSDVDALLKATANQRGVMVAKVRAKTEQSVAAIKLKMADAESVLLDKSREASRAADIYVRENPWRNMGIIAGLGLLAGLLIGRR